MNVITIKSHSHQITQEDHSDNNFWPKSINLEYPSYLVCPLFTSQFCSLFPRMLKNNDPFDVPGHVFVSLLQSSLPWFTFLISVFTIYSLRLLMSTLKGWWYLKGDNNKHLPFHGFYCSSVALVGAVEILCPFTACFYVFCRCRFFTPLLPPPNDYEIIKYSGVDLKT